MKKRILSALTAVLLIFTLSFVVFATSPLLVDNAKVLDAVEYAHVNELLSDASAEHDASFVIVTVNDTDGKEMQEYADDFFDYGGYDIDGILLLIDMDRGDYWFSTSGKYDSYEVNYTALDNIEDKVFDFLVEGDFYGAFVAYAEDCARIEELSAQCSASGDREGFSLGSSIFIALIIGVIVAFIVTSVLKGQLKSVKHQTRAESYVIAGSMNVTEARDLFLYHHITRTPRPKSNSNSSGSHRSSSGRSHGGRGGSFR